MADNRTVSVVLQAKTDQFKASMTESAKAARDMALAVEGAGKKVGYSAGLIEASSKKAESARTKEAESAARLVAAEKRLEEAKANGASKGSQVAAAEAGVLSARNSLERATDELTAAEREHAQVVKDSNSTLKTAGKFAKDYSHELTTAGTAMAAFGGAVVGALGLSAKAAMSWESAFAGVLKTVNGTPRQLAQVEEGLRGLTKVLPASHEEIAAVAEAAGQLGIKTGNVVSFTKTMIDMGESTNLSAEDAATSLARLANIMGTSQSDFGKMGASIVGLGNNFATTEREIVEMSMRIAGVGKQAGLTEGDVFGLATALSSVGIDAEAGGTAISMVMKKIGNEVAGGGDKVEEFARIAGMSSSEFSAAWRDDAGGALNSFIQGLGNAQAQGENVNGTLTALGITGIRESDALLRLSASGDVLANALKQGNDEFDRGKALAEEAAKRYETAESKIKIAGNSLKDTAITIGGTFLPAIASAAESFSKFVEGIGNIPEPVLKVGAVLAAIAGSAALAGGAALILIPKIAETVAAISTLKVAAASSTGAMGKMAAGMGKLKGAAVGAAAGLAVLAVAGDPLSKWGNSAVEATGETADALQNLSGQIAQSSLDTATLNKAFTDIVAPTDELGEFGNAVKEVIDPNGWGVFGDIATDTARVISLGLVDMKSGTEEARERFAALGEQLATLNSEDAAKASESFKQMVAETDGSAESVTNLINLMPAYKDQLIQTAQAMGKNTDNSTLAKIAMGEIVGPAGEAAGAVGGVGEAAGAASDGLQDMLDGLVALGLATLSERDALRGYEDAIDGISESIKSNGTSLDITTAKGRANQEAFDDLAKSGLDAAYAMVQNGADQKTVQDQLQRTYDDLVAAAGKFGVTGKKAEDMAKEVMGIPKDVDIKTWMSNAAQKQAKDLKEILDELNGKTVKTFVKVEETYIRKNKGEATYSKDRYGNAPAARAKGAIDLKPMASGGVLSNIAEMVPPNTWRVVGDRMDVDEAFIPLDGSPRSVKILMEAIKRMPGLGMARGGISSAQNRVDSAQDSLKSARRAKQDAKSSKAKAAATRRVRNAEDELAAAKKSLKAAQAKAKSDEQAAKLAARQAKEAAEAAAKRRKEERERRARVGELQSDLRTDVRRGTIRDSVTSGLSGGLSQVDQLSSLGGNKDLSKASRSRANTSARKFEANLTSLYKQAEKIDEKLKKAQDKATELKGIKDSVTSSLLGGRGVDVGDYQNFEGGQWSTYSGVAGATRRMTADVGAMKAFAGKLKKLASKGIPGAIIQEIAQAGVAEGSTMADAFLEASDAEVKSYVGAWKDYERYAGQAGQYVTEGFYSGGSAAADGVVKGLEGQQKNVEKAIANLAKAMESTFKSVLGIHSPSRVMAELGGFTAEGLALGMLAGVEDVQSAAAALGMAAVPTTGVSVEVGAAPVAESDEGIASTAMQDMSATTLESMALMQLAVSDGFAAMLANTQAAQAGMLLDTQTNQLGMLTSTQTQNAAMLLDIQTQQAAMLLNTQTQQEAMRSTVDVKQNAQRTVMTDQQELMRLMLIDKQSLMKSRAESDFESLKNTTASKFSSMRSNTDATMLGLHSDYSGRLSDLKGLNSDGFASILRTADKNMQGVRDGIDGQMAAAKPEMGGRLNSLIGVLAKFTESVNKAFGDVGVKLKSPQPLKFATGGVMPGYSPGADIHKFVSPTAGELHLSGGEAIMRPEWTRAMGGARGVKAQNDAAREGRFDDLLHMQESGHFATGGVYGRVPGVNAFADSGVWRNLWAITKAEFPNASLNSAYRGGSITASGNTSHHSRGNAIDVSPSMEIFNFWRNKYGANLAELIYSPANGKQIKNGKNYTYGEPVRGMHFDHVHIAALRALSDAMAGGLPGMGGEMSHPFLDRAKVSAGGDLAASYKKAAEKLTADIYGKFSKQLPSGEFGQLGKGIMSQVSEGLVKKATDYGKNAGSADFGNVASGPVKTMARDMLKQMGWEDQFGDLDWLLTRESGWNPKAQNPTSTAYGLFQFLNGTWGSVGATKTSDPKKQLEAGMKYIQQRYGDVKGARSFWERNHWYEDGTNAARKGWAVVGENGPELVKLNGGETVKNGAQTRKLLAENRTFIPNNGGSSGGLDYDALAKAVVSNLPPSLVVNNDNAGLIEERIAKKTVQEFADKQALYSMGV